MQFLNDGRIEVDTKSVERTLRPVALQKERTVRRQQRRELAAIASLVETCKLNGVDPQRYLAELLTRLVNGWPQARIGDLMPWCSAETRSA